MGSTNGSSTVYAGVVGNRVNGVYVQNGTGQARVNGGSTTSG